MGHQSESKWYPISHRTCGWRPPSALFCGAQGRFTSVDPENRGATPDDPQNWNGYPYARNNPLLYTDPTGEGIQICDNNNENCANSEFSREYFERTNQNLRFNGGVINAVNEDGSLTRVGTYTEFADYEDATGGLLLFAGLARAAVSGAVALVDSAATSLSRSYVRLSGSEAGVLRLGGSAKNSGAEFLHQSWNKATFPNVMQTVRHHWSKHAKGLGKSLDEYTTDALNFFKANKHLGKTVPLRDGTQGILIRTAKGQPGGFFTPQGQIVSFWYK